MYKRQGLHQLLIIAIAATYLTDSVLCIEEPEMNMHPSLQRRLLGYLRKNTTNQYFITTHSAALVDISEDVAVFHVEHDGHQTIINSVLTPQQRRTICDDLGFRPSDLVQANALIWVEGPSDRIYLNRLIKQLSANLLKEGTHYSFAFYGGSLRAHYSIDESTGQVIETTADTLGDLVDLLPINRNAVMVADSDLSQKGDEVKDPHKKRLMQEFSNCSSGFYWQTEGRTIENYIDQNIFIKARTKVHPIANFDKFTGKFTDLVTARSKSGGNWSSDKVEIATIVCLNDEPFDTTTDIYDKGRQVVALISKWNGLRSVEKDM